MSDDDRRQPSSAPIDWRRSAAPVFRAGPLPGGHRLEPLPQPPSPQPARPALSRPVDLFRDSLVPQARPTAPDPTPVSQPKPTPSPDLTVRPLPPIPAPAPKAAPAPVTAVTPKPAPAPSSASIETVVVPAFAQSAARARPSRPVLIGGAAMAVLAAGVAVWLLLPRSSETPITGLPPVAVVAAAPPAVDATMDGDPMETAEVSLEPASAPAAAPIPEPRLANETETAPPPRPPASRTETAAAGSESEPATTTPPAPVIETAPLLEPVPQPPVEPPTADPAPRTDGETIVTRPR